MHGAVHECGLWLAIGSTFRAAVSARWSSMEASTGLPLTGLQLPHSLIALPYQIDWWGRGGHGTGPCLFCAAILSLLFLLV